MFTVFILTKGRMITGVMNMTAAEKKTLQDKGILKFVSNKKCILTGDILHKKCHRFQERLVLALSALVDDDGKTLSAEKEGEGEAKAELSEQLLRGVKLFAKRQRLDADGVAELLTLMERAACKERTGGRVVDEARDMLEKLQKSPPLLGKRVETTCQAVLHDAELAVGSYCEARAFLEASLPEQERHVIPEDGDDSGWTEDEQGWRHMEKWPGVLFRRVRNKKGQDFFVKTINNSTVDNPHLPVHDRNLIAMMFSHMNWMGTEPLVDALYTKLDDPKEVISIVKFTLALLEAE